MSSISYHKAGTEDVPTLIELRTLFAMELSGNRSEEAYEQLRAQLENYFTGATASGECISIVAKCGSEVAGIGSLMVRNQPGNLKNPSGKWGYIMNMYTVQAYRRRGICKGILDHLLQEGRKVGITAFEMHATPAGEMVYKNNGFAIYEEPTYRRYEASLALAGYDQKVNSIDFILYGIFFSLDVQDLQSARLNGLD